MEQSDLLHFTVAAVERLDLRYFVTGSTVTIFYGEPRFTNDIDIVVEFPPGAVAEFCRQFPGDDFWRGCASDPRGSASLDGRFLKPRCAGSSCPEKLDSFGASFWSQDF